MLNCVGVGWLVIKLVESTEQTDERTKNKKEERKVLEMIYLSGVNVDAMWADDAALCSLL